MPPGFPFSNLIPGKSPGDVITVLFQMKNEQKEK